MPNKAKRYPLRSNLDHQLKLPFKDMMPPAKIHNNQSKKDKLDPFDLMPLKEIESDLLLELYKLRFGHISIEDWDEMLRYLPADHEIEARQTCARRFIEDVLLPRFQEDNFTALTAESLIRLVRDFKIRFHDQYPDDFTRPFEIIPLVNLELMKLSIRLEVAVQAASKTKIEQPANPYITKGAEPDPTEYVRRLENGIQHVRYLIEENPEDLYAV